MLVIYDERLNRQCQDIVKLNDNFDEMRDIISEKSSGVKEIHSEIKEIKNTMKDDSKILGSEMKDIRETERSNIGQMMKSFEEVKEAIKSNESEIRSELKKASVVPDKKDRPTFADKLKMMANEPMVILKPKNAQDNRKTKSDLKSMIDPSSIKINRARDLADGGIALACCSSSASKQLQATALEKNGR